jgi:glycosyltransferase involved in cell wall biosynthesis
MKRFVLISLGLPPSQTGQSMVLFHLLRTLPPETYCLVTLRNFHLYRYLESCSARLPARYYFLHPDYQFIRLLVKAASRFSLKPLLSLVLKIRVRQIKKILRGEHAEVVVACTGDLFDPPAAFIAARELRIPFILYSFDYFSHQWTDKVTRSFAEEHECEILHGARQVIVPNECMAKEYLRQYGVSPAIIHNPFDMGEYEKNRSTQPAGRVMPPGQPDGVRIVYTGAVYEAHYDAFRNLIAAIPKTGIPGLMLHIYTPQSPGQLQAHGISGPVTIHKARPNSEMPAVHHSADILFLPLAFNSPYPDIIRTSAPGKTGEYLASERPILVHAPKDSFIAWYFSKNQCGDVVSENDSNTLAEHIIRLVHNDEYCQELTRNAYILAREQFDAGSAREKLLAIINNETSS